MKTEPTVIKLGDLNNKSGYIGKYIFYIYLYYFHYLYMSMYYTYYTYFTENNEMIQIDSNSKKFYSF